MRLPSLLAVTLLCAGCVSMPAPDRSASAPMFAGVITPPEAVLAANNDPEHGISGTFMLTVRAVGEDHDRIYINSEENYRHQANLTLALPASERAVLQQQLGLQLEQLINRRLLVRGTARRNTIVFTTDGQPSGKYYYQTQIHLRSAKQIRFAP